MEFDFLSADAGFDDSVKLCECGCGKPTNRAQYDDFKRGLKKGDVQRFLRGHWRTTTGRDVDGLKRCNTCGEKKPATTEFFYTKHRKRVGVNPWNNLNSKCIECERTRYRDLTPERRAVVIATRKRYFRTNQKTISAKGSAMRLALKREMADAYGGACTCCGETEVEFLTIEHINGDAVQHRKSLNTTAGGYVIYQDLKKRGWPKDGYTVLCYNCNCASSGDRICPHKRPKPSSNVQGDLS